MPAHTIYDTAPLGSLVRYFDNQPKPPARFTKKLAAWETRNGIGRLVRKQPGLHEGNFASGSVILVTVMRSHSVDSDLSFEIVERPKLGMVRVLHPIGDDEELLHLAETHEAAELWLAKAGYSRARLEEVTADEVGADVVEGRAAA